MHQRIAYSFIFFIPLLTFGQTNKKGDVNGDGVVNAADIVEVVNIIMQPDAYKEDISQMYSLNLISDTCVYSSKTHAAFTSLINYQGELYLAFREASAHRPSNTSDYGHIIVLQKLEDKWIVIADLSHPDMDLRDPFFIVMDGKLRMYCGYNQFVGEGNSYQHSGTAYADLTNSGWSEFKIVRHDAPHIVWIWKIRKHEDHYYGVGYLEGNKPILFKSINGEDWNTVSELDVDGIVSEADLNFIGDSLYICLRKDTPTGSPSYWGKSIFPFSKFDWKVMDKSIACPDFFCHPETKQMWITGREYEKDDSGRLIVSVSLYEVTSNGNLDNRIKIYEHGSWDKGYPSIFIWGICFSHIIQE